MSRQGVELRVVGIAKRSIWICVVCFGSCGIDAMLVLVVAGFRPLLDICVNCQGKSIICS